MSKKGGGKGIRRQFVKDMPVFEGRRRTIGATEMSLFYIPLHLLFILMAGGRRGTRWRAVQKNGFFMDCNIKRPPLLCAVSNICFFSYYLRGKERKKKDSERSFPSIPVPVFPFRYIGKRGPAGGAWKEEERPGFFFLAQQGKKVGNWGRHGMRAISNPPTPLLYSQKPFPGNLRKAEKGG